MSRVLSEVRVIAVVVTLIFLTTGCYYPRQRIVKFEILEALICGDVDEQMNAIDVRNVFDYGTPKVCLWIKYRFATKNTVVFVRWFYRGYLVYIGKYSVPINRDRYGYFLMMKGGKPLPKGAYKVEVMVGGKVVRKLPFWIR